MLLFREGYGLKLWFYKNNYFCKFLSKKNVLYKYKDNSYVGSLGLMEEIV